MLWSWQEKYKFSRWSRLTCPSTSLQAGSGCSSSSRGGETRCSRGVGGTRSVTRCVRAESSQGVYTTTGPQGPRCDPTSAEQLADKTNNLMWQLLKMYTTLSFIIWIDGFIPHNCIFKQSISFGHISGFLVCILLKVTLLCVYVCIYECLYICVYIYTVCIYVCMCMCVVQEPKSHNRDFLLTGSKSKSVYMYTYISSQLSRDVTFSVIYDLS